MSHNSTGSISHSSAGSDPGPRNNEPGKKSADVGKKSTDAGRKGPRRAKEADEIPYSQSEALSEDNNGGIGDGRDDTEKMRIECENVQKRAFRILNKMSKQGITFEIKNIRAIKEVVQEFKNDYYVIKNSLFMLMEDTDFILDNLLTFKSFIFEEMDKSPYREQFFGNLISGNIEIDLPMALQIYPYLRSLGNVNKRLYYEKMLFLSCTIEDLEDDDDTASTQSSASSSSTSLLGLDDNSGKDDGHGRHEGKGGRDGASGRKKGMSSIRSDTIALVEELWEDDNEMFLKICIGNPAFPIIFKNVSFKTALFAATIGHGKKTEYLVFLRTLAPTLSRNEKRLVLAQNVELFKPMLTYSNVNFQATMLVLDLLDGEFVEPYHKIIYSVLYALSERIASGIQLNFKFDQDIEILGKIAKFDIQDNQIQVELKNCLFNLLESRKYQEGAFLVIYEVIQKNPSFTIFVDAFVQYFASDKFFFFAVPQKISLLAIISSYPQINTNAIFENLFSGFETSYFMSFQSTNQHKIDSIKHLCALMLANKKGTFDAFGNKLVSTVNMLINSTKNIKKFAYILSTIVILKITEEKILHLYPILFEDMISYSIRESSHSYTILREILRCIDTSVCLNSTVFDFRLLLLVDKDNDKGFKTLLLNALEKEYSEKNVQISAVIRERMEKTSFNCRGNGGVPGKLMGMAAASSALSLSTTAIALQKFESDEYSPGGMDSLLRGAQSMDDLIYYLKEYDSFYKWIETSFVVFNIKGIEEDLINVLSI